MNWLKRWICRVCPPVMPESIPEVEKMAILNALHKYRTKIKAAEVLKISRANLYFKMQEYGIALDENDKDD